MLSTRKRDSSIEPQRDRRGRATCVRDVYGPDNRSGRGGRVEERVCRPRLALEHLFRNVYHQSTPHFVMERKAGVEAPPGVSPTILVPLRLRNCPSATAPIRRSTGPVTLSRDTMASRKSVETKASPPPETCAALCSWAWC